MNILTEDKYLLICQKPVGMPSQSNGSEDLVKAVCEYTGSSVYIINRLDQPVGGLVLFAKDKKTAALLSNENFEIKKEYAAVICGEALDYERLTNYVFHNKRENVTKIVNKGSMGAKKAELEYTKLKEVTVEGEIFTLIRVHLITGRHHQIRVQTAARGTPLWGDVKYNPEFKHKRTQIGLYSCGISFRHPILKQEINVSVKPVGTAFDFFEGEVGDVD